MKKEMNYDTTKYIEIIDDGKLKTSELMDSLRKKFDVYYYWDNETLDKEFPRPKKKTVRYFKKEQESGDRKGESWNDMKDVRNDLMSFREYILFFEEYYKQTGKYPDEISWTIFGDSLSDGDVATGYWNPSRRKVRFYCYYPVNRYSLSGGRVAISLPLPLSTSSLKSDESSLFARVEKLEQWEKKFNKFD